MPQAVFNQNPSRQSAAQLPQQLTQQVSGQSSAKAATEFATEQASPQPSANLKHNFVPSEQAISYWQQSKELIRLQISDNLFRAFCVPLEVISYCKSCRTLTLNADSAAVSSYVEERLTSVITESFASITDQSCKLVLRSAKPAAAQPDALAGSQPLPPALVTKDKELTAAGQLTKTQRELRAQQKKNTFLNQKQDFSNYVVSSGNEFAVSIARQFLASKTQENYNPLYVYGDVGLGKTHLLNAIGHAYLAEKPHAKVYYTSAENFTNKSIFSLRNGKIEQFRKQIRSVDLLLVDDVQFFKNKKHTMEEFFHTFNSLIADDKKIVIAADSPARNIVDVDEKLISRFCQGISVKLSLPDFNSRKKISWQLLHKLTAKSDQIVEQCPLSEIIAAADCKNLRELQGICNRVSALRSLTKSAVSPEQVRGVIKDFINPVVQRVTKKDIKLAVANYFQLKVSDITSKRRLKTIALARQIAAFLIRKHTSHAYTEIALCLGRKEHSSIIYAVNQITERRGEQPELARQINEIELSLGVKL